MRRVRHFFPTIPRIGATYVTPNHTLPRDRRGVTALVFAVCATFLLGFVALATEAASWYLARLQAYNVADAAAIAGALAAGFQVGASGNPATYSSDLSATAEAAATYVATINGFTTGQSSLAGATNVNVSASYNQTAGTSQVSISMSFIPLLASVVNSSTIFVMASAVAQLEPVGYACALSLEGDLTITIAQSGLNAGYCYYASNSRNPTSVTIPPDVSGNASFYIFAYGITSEGDCSGCPVVTDTLAGGFDTSGSNYLARPNASYQPPATDPFATQLSGLTYPDVSTIVCPASLLNDLSAAGISVGANNCPTQPSAFTVSESALLPSSPDPLGSNPTSACGTVSAGSVCAYYNMDITISSPVALSPGTYLLINSSLDIATNANVTCSVCGSENLDHQSGADLGTRAGVTIVMASLPNVPAPDPGRLIIDPFATVQLSPASSAAYPGSGGYLNGILFYRDPTYYTPDSPSSPSVMIGDIVGNTQLIGALYFPGANVWFGANVGPAPPLCFVIAAGTLNLGYAPNFSTAGSPGYDASFSAAGGPPNATGVSSACTGYATPVPRVQAPKLVQ
jgi:Flp pilus assembly protein TadG